jgi:hypothetical protein
VNRVQFEGLYKAPVKEISLGTATPLTMLEQKSKDKSAQFTDLQRKKLFGQGVSTEGLDIVAVLYAKERNRQEEKIQKYEH